MTNGLRIYCFSLLCILLIIQAAPAQQSAHRINNQDVIDLVSLELSDDIIIEKIQSAEFTDFDTSVAGLRTLKVSHVSDAVIKAMIHSHGGAPALLVSPDPSRSSAQIVPEEVGVYLSRKGTWVQLEPEIVGWRQGGVFKHYATLGFDREHINGSVRGPRSAMRLATPAEFLIKTQEGTSATEYQLLQLYQKGDRREFRALTGGIYHASSGAERNAVPFQVEKVANRTWRVRLSGLSPGEYGFLPPGFAATSIASSGKLYSFAFNPEESDSRSGAKIPQVSSSGVDPQPMSDASAAESASIGASSDASPSVYHDGVTLSHVVPGGPCDKAGIVLGDVLLAIDDHYFFTLDQMYAEIRRHKVGARVSIRYRRRSTIYEVPVILAAAH